MLALVHTEKVTNGRLGEERLQRISYSDSRMQYAAMRMRVHVGHSPDMKCFV